MPHRKMDAPPLTRIEQALHDAITRLENGNPTHPALIKLKQEERLRVNQTNVALETGHALGKPGGKGVSRTNFLKYTKVKARIDEHANTPEAEVTKQDVIRAKREKIAELTAEKRVALSVLAAMAIRMLNMESQHKAELRAAQRGTKNPHQVIGADSQPSAEGGKVVQFPTGGQPDQQGD